MKLSAYLKGNIPAIVIDVFVFLFIYALLSVMQVNGYAIAFIMLLMVISRTIIFMLNFSKRKAYFDNVYECLNNIDKKCLVFEMIDDAEFIEGHYMYDILRECNKAMNDEIAIHKKVRDHLF